MADLTQQINEARTHGYSDEEITSYLGKSHPELAPKIQEATASGYKPTEILGHLSAAPASQKPAGPRGFWDSLGDKLESVDTGLEQGIGDAARGVWEMGKRILLPPQDTRGKVAGTILGPAGPLVSDIAMSHVDTFKKAVEAAKQRNYARAAAYAGATLIPGAGPMAASIGEVAGGSPAEHDKYGNVVVPQQPPQPARAVGQVLGNVAIGGLTAGAGDVAGMAGDVVRTGKTAAREAVRIPSTLNPVEQAAVDFLDQREVPTNAGTRTGNKFVKGAQALVQNQPLGAAVAAKAARATETGLTRVAGELANEAHPAPVTPESAGQGVIDAISKRISAQKAAADQAYAPFRKAMNDPSSLRTVETGKAADGTPVTEDMAAPVDMRNIKEALEPQLREMEKWMQPALRNASAGFQAIKSIVQGPDFIPAVEAEHGGLSGLKSLAREGAENPDLRDVNQGIGARASKMLQDEIDGTVQAIGGPEALRHLQAGRAATASKIEIGDLAKRLRKEPVQAFDQQLWRNDTGIDFLREIQKQAPEQMAPIGRAFVQQLFDKATREGGFSKARTVMDQWEALGPQTKTILYPDPALRANLTKFFKGASMVAENPNPSGTAVVGSLIPGGMLAIQNPVAGSAWLLGGYAAAKLLFSPRGVALLTDGLKQQGPGAAAFTAARIRAIAGKDIKPIILPTQTPSNSPMTQNQQ